MTATLKNAISNGYSLDELWRMYDEDDHIKILELRINDEENAPRRVYSTQCSFALI